MVFVKIRKMKASTKNRRGRSSARDCLRLLEQHLGLEPGRIARLRAESEVVSEICADYEECCGELRHLEQKDDARHHYDYLEMRDQLERDLLRYVQGADPQPGHGKRNDPTKTK